LWFWLPFAKDLENIVKALYRIFFPTRFKYRVGHKLPPLADLLLNDPRWEEVFGGDLIEDARDIPDVYNCLGTRWTDCWIKKCRPLDEIVDDHPEVPWDSPHRKNLDNYGFRTITVDYTPPIDAFAYEIGKPRNEQLRSEFVLLGNQIFEYTINRLSGVYDMDYIEISEPALLDHLFEEYKRSQSN
jgi:hypothetical protein